MQTKHVCALSGLSLSDEPGQTGLVLLKRDIAREGEAVSDHTWKFRPVSPPVFDYQSPTPGLAGRLLLWYVSKMYYPTPNIGLVQERASAGYLSWTSPTIVTPPGEPTHTRAYPAYVRRDVWEGLQELEHLIPFRYGIAPVSWRDTFTRALALGQKGCEGLLEENRNPGGKGFELSHVWEILAGLSLSAEVSEYLVYNPEYLEELCDPRELGPILSSYFIAQLAMHHLRLAWDVGMLEFRPNYALRKAFFIKMAEVADRAAEVGPKT